MSRTSTGWKYYSELVPGYVEKYSNKGMRERNRKILKQLEGTTGERRLHLENLLAENNQPLAKYVAERYGAYLGWNKAERQDAFQECCAEIIGYIRKMENGLSPVYFQHGIYLAMTSRLQRLDIRRKEMTIRADKEFIETDYIPEPEAPKANKETLTQLAYYVLQERDAAVLCDYYFGDEENYIVPMNADDVAMKYGITSATIYNIVNKGIDKLAEYVRNSKRGKTPFKITDLIKE